MLSLKNTTGYWQYQTGGSGSVFLVLASLVVDLGPVTTQVSGGPLGVSKQFLLTSSSDGSQSAGLRLNLDVLGLISRAGQVRLLYISVYLILN